MLPSDKRNILDRVEERYVLFADMLGFAGFTEQHLPTEDEFARLHYKRDEDGRIVDVDTRIDASPLVTAFLAFHNGIEKAVAAVRKNGSTITTVAFSDSALVISSNFNAACAVAISLMNDLLPQSIMCRVGIATGTILHIRFRSDTSLTHGDYAAQFLGTAVVRAYAAAEKSKLSGARILIHPSIVFDGGDLHTMEENARRHALYQPLHLADSEWNNALGVAYEINYLGREDRRLYRGVFKASKTAPAEAFKHYDGTFKAMSRMRTALGRPPISEAFRPVQP
jgi:hypothetical protein